MYLFKEYARTATTEADNKRNIHENVFLKFFVQVIRRYCSQLSVPSGETKRIIIIRFTAANIAQVGCKH